MYCPTGNTVINLFQNADLDTCIHVSISFDIKVYSMILISASQKMYPLLNAIAYLGIGLVGNILPVVGDTADLKIQIEEI